MKEVRLYINKRCPLNCDFCSYRYLESSKNDEEIFYIYDLKDKLFQLLNILNCYNLMISGKEPLVDDNWFKYLKYIKLHFISKRTFFTHINSNGIMLNKKKHNNLVQFALRKKFLDRFLISVNYEESEKQFKNVLDWSSDITKKVQPYMVIEKTNIDFLKKMIMKGIDVGIYKFYLRFMIPIQEKVKNKIIPFKEQEKILNDFLQMINKYSAKKIFIQTPLDYKLNINEMTNEYMNDEIIIEKTDFDNIVLQKTFPRYWCHQYQDGITILHNGDIVGCAKHTYCVNYKKFVIANLLTDDIDTIVKNIKKAIKNTNIYDVCLPKKGK